MQDLRDVLKWFAVENPSDLLLASWADGSVVYSLVSGGFTALNVTATEVLRLLRDDGDQSLDGLASRLLGEMVTQDETAQLMAMLEQLRELGLIDQEVV